MHGYKDRGNSTSASKKPTASSQTFAMLSADRTLTGRNVGLDSNGNNSGIPHEEKEAQKIVKIKNSFQHSTTKNFLCMMTVFSMPSAKAKDQHSMNINKCFPPY